MKEDPSEPITVIIADDHVLYRAGVKTSLSAKKDIKVIAEADNGMHLLNLIRNIPVDVILLDIQMPIMDGIAALPEIKKISPHTKVIMLTFMEDNSMITKLMELGANSYLAKTSDVEIIYEAIKTCYNQEYYFNSMTNKALLTNLKQRNFTAPPQLSAPEVSLNDKETTILRLMCEEKSTKEIADIVELSPRTVEAIRDKLKVKTGAKSTAGLIMYAVKHKDHRGTITINSIKYIPARGDFLLGTMRYFSYNSKFFPEGTPIIGPDNRGLRYGDGLFETMKWINGSIVMADAHLDRLWTGMEKLAFQLPVLFSREFVLTQIHKLLAKNKDTTARIRLTVTRGDGGLYDPADHHPNLIIQTWPLAAATPLNENGLQLGIYTGALKVCDQFSNLKHNNYLCYLMGAIYAKNHQFNDAVMLNQHLRVCDSTIANLFIFKNNIVYTPSLAEGCVAGIMRQMLLSALPALGYEVKETEITREDLLDADEVFLSNSMYNIRWVSSIEQTVFKQQQVNQLVQRLRQTNGNVFC